MEALPGWFWVAEIAGVAGLFATVAVVLRQGAGRTGNRLAAAAAVALGGWLLVTAYLADAGVYRTGPDQAAAAIGIAIAAVIGGGLFATRIPAVAASLNAPGALARITALQTYRVIGGLFLVALALGEIPAVFALPAGLGDIAVGVAAPFVARRLARDPSARTGAIGFHLLGMLDLVVAVTIGVLAAPGRLNLLHTVPTTEQLALLPLNLIPTAAVPVVVVLHIVALRQLRRPAMASATSLAAA
jgi:hypothetical protein